MKSKRQTTLDLWHGLMDRGYMPQVRMEICLV